MRLSPLALALTLALAPAAASAEDDAMRAAHEAVRAALLERATLPARPPSLPDGATMMEPESAPTTPAAPRRSARRTNGRSVAASSTARVTWTGTTAPSRARAAAGCRAETPAGECGEAARAVRTREMHGGMDGGHTGGGTDGGPHGREMSGGVALHPIALALALALGAPDGGAEAPSSRARRTSGRRATPRRSWSSASPSGSESARPPPTRARRSKLERWDEAVETFETAAPRRSPAPRLLPRAGVLRSSPLHLHGSPPRGHRRPVGAAHRRAGAGDTEEIARILSAPPSDTSLAWYRARCEARRAEGRTALAAAYCRETNALAARRPGRRARLAATPPPPRARGEAHDRAAPRARPRRGGPLRSGPTGGARSRDRAGLPRGRGRRARRGISRRRRGGVPRRAGARSAG